MNDMIPPDQCYFFYTFPNNKINDNFSPTTYSGNVKE